MTRKLIFIAVLLFIFNGLRAQLTLENTYNVSTGITYIDNEGYKYYAMDVANKQCKIYNLDHNLWKTINLEIPANNYLADIQFVYNKTFNHDDKIELLYIYYEYITVGSTYYYIYGTKVLNEDGTLLLSVPGGGYSQLLWTGEEGYKLFIYVYDYSVSPYTVATKVYGLPSKADFSASPTYGSAPLNVQFTNTSTGSPESYLWDFGDGTTATEKNPAHLYTTAGTYIVSLTVTDNGVSNTVVKSGFIQVLGDFDAAFIASSQIGNVPMEVLFTDISTGNPTSWAWNFGDGNTSAEQNPTHIYTEAGIYTVSLTISDGSNEDTESISNYINVDFPVSINNLQQPDNNTNIFPNPFSSQTNIHYYLQNEMNVVVEIYNTSGQLVKTVFNGKQTAGQQNIVWQGTDNSGTNLSSGVYNCIIRGENGFSVNRKVVLSE